MTASKNPPSIDIGISIEDEEWENKIPDLDDFLNETLETAIMRGLSEKRITAPETIEISIVLADNNFVQDLNKRYRNKDKPTNVLSFPQTEEEEIEMNAPFLSLGDIIIARETIESESIEQDKSFTDHFRHMLVHGCLHLLHYDHETDEEANVMETLEISILQNFGIKNPYQNQLD
ncbi:MAG: rRNA maturation RNase YbeY [Alphaproteobacteria bacterium]|nr:rRNA maturation RNase YbeY [Alphaproteobacteria bacterium]